MAPKSCWNQAWDRNRISVSFWTC